ncbi:hypothetical protein INT47_006878 [Mucor saturninus]|uniref:SNRNP25 ubiquitin-like domain-containing protein n=1 Tax=Mucor saturninus TaxID=64648 RepID=A0A8H7RCW0_9FUNG|nr:hypothetical protein INT47_006878 [Mucor saturninus]
MSNQDQELLIELQGQIDQLLESHELQDLTSWPTEGELDTLIAVEQGQAFHITLQRDPLPSIPLTVLQSSSVLQIKHMIRLQLEKMEKNKGRHRRISWKYIWRSYCLMFDHTKLSDDNAVVSQLGIKQDSVLRFSRLAHAKGHHRKAWRHR